MPVKKDNRKEKRGRGRTGETRPPSTPPTPPRGLGAIQEEDRLLLCGVDPMAVRPGAPLLSQRRLVVRAVNFANLATAKAKNAPTTQRAKNAADLGM